MISKTTTVVRKRVSSLRMSPENEELYRPVAADDPEVRQLAGSINKHGVMEPLVVTEDRYIVSGHRRFVAAKLAGQKTVPCRVEPIKRSDDHDAFVVLLREYNRQRDKTFAEKMRAELVTTNPAQAYFSLIEHRELSAMLNGANTVEIEGEKRRSKISAAKSQMLEACERVVFEERRKYWPLSIRAIHYVLCHNPPLRHTGKPESRYINDKNSYQDLSNLLTRARLAGIIPWESITDDNRPRAVWNVWADCRGFIRQQLDQFMKGYWRDLMQSQPNHVEVIVEKNTAYTMVKDTTSRYCITTMSGRGFSSIDPYHDIEQRYLKSGKTDLMVIVVSDFDPEGEEIVHVAGRTLRDDFGILRTRVIKAAIGPQHIKEFDLPSSLDVKPGGSRYKKFTAKHGHNAYELEALGPEQLQSVLTDVLDSVIDVDLFNRELDAEREDAVHIEAVRKAAIKSFEGLGL